MADEEEQVNPAIPKPEAIANAAARNAADGIQSYSHGSRQVTRSNPRTQLEFAQDLELRDRRKRRGIVMGITPTGELVDGGAGEDSGGGGEVAGVASLNGEQGDIELVQGENVYIRTETGRIIIGATGGGGGGDAGVSSINGEDGDIILAAGEGVSIAEVDGTFTFSTTETGGVSSVNGAEGAITLKAGENIGIEQSGGELTINARASGVESVNGAAGDIELAAGDNVSIQQDGGRLTINVESGGMNARTITESGSVQPTDGIIWIDTRALSASASIALAFPDMDADSQSIVVRRIGENGAVALVRDGREWPLAYDGDGIAADWNKETGEWFWRAY